MQTRLIRESEFTPAQEKSYAHFPFGMPAHATRLDVAYSYTQRISADPSVRGGNTLDLGVFDARGIEFLNAGFRGWSGSERETFSITETQATPGYLAGALMPGTWHVVLGLYKIAPEGCAYRVEITITFDAAHDAPGEPPAPIARLPGSRERAGWLRGELHCHTIHSDGDGTVRELIEMARARGFDFLAITDHNTTSHQHELAAAHDPGLILIRGVEVTTFAGHFNVWGAGEWVDFRVESIEQMNAALRRANALGALTSCNHPKLFGPDWDYKDAVGYQCIEVWNGPWYALNQMSLDFWLARIGRGERVVAVGGSDYHRRAELQELIPRAPGTPTVWVYVPDAPSEANILAAVRRGRVSLSDAPHGPFVELRAGDARMGDVVAPPANDWLEVRVHCERGAGYTLRLLDQQRIVFEQMISGEDAWVKAAVDVRASLFVRGELRDAENTMRAMTNPIYFNARQLPS